LPGLISPIAHKTRRITKMSMKMHPSADMLLGTG
jgi:hypothetical protein